MQEPPPQKEKFFEKLIKGKDELRVPYIGKGLLDTDDRVSEILTGIIMILTFTCTFSVIKTDSTSVIDMLKGAICSTMAWGFIDAIMYLFMAMINKEHNLTFLNFVRKSKDINKIHQVISDALPETLSKIMQPDEIEALRKKTLLLPEPATMYRLQFSDYITAFGIFLLVFFATIPISVPFVVIKDMNIAMRISNITALVMMFICGAVLGKYAGRNRFVLGVLTSLIGIILVSVTILLGG
jgi:VIT1/CCC1 family predicted Fe2+/Mn2+ transporter